MGNNGQQWTIICGATCISDAVFDFWNWKRQTYPWSPTRSPHNVVMHHIISGLVGYFSTNGKIENKHLSLSLEFRTNLSTHLTGWARDGEIVGLGVQDNLLSCQPPPTDQHQIHQFILWAAPHDDDDNNSKVDKPMVVPPNGLCKVYFWIHDYYFLGKQSYLFGLAFPLKMPCCLRLL